MLLAEFLESGAERWPEREALVCGDRRLTFRGLDEQANRLAHGLRALQLRRGDRVAVWLDNSPEAVTAIFGIGKADGVFTVLHPQIKPQKLELILNDCQARILVTSARLARGAREALARCPALTAVIAVGEPAEPDTMSWTAVLESSSPSRPERRAIDLDLAALIYTSGSTGVPKGVMLTHLNMVSAAASITAYLENRPGDIILSCLPLSFDYGLYQVLMAARVGGTVVLETAFVYPLEVLALLQRERATGFPLVPAMAALLLELKPLSDMTFPHLRYLTNTAQALPVKHIRGLQAAFPGAKLFSMYGLTECKRVAYLPPEELSRRPASVGKAMPNVETYLVDDQGREITAPDTPGELVVRGANVMRGYWNRPEETARRLKPGRVPGETVLYTGDLFTQDAEGFLYFVSRRDDIIKTAGEMVSPKEVENALYELEGVSEAAVTGVPDPILGQAVLARIALAAGAVLTENDVLRHCARYLEKFAMPKRIEFVASLPKTLTGKIRKTEPSGEA